MSSCWPAIPPPPPSSQPKGAGCSRSWGNRALVDRGWDPRAGALALDRLEEADAWAGRAAELGASDDAITQMLWRQVRVTIGEGAEMLFQLGDAYADLAEVGGARELGDNAAPHRDLQAS
jgi:hypothetical protein